MRRLARLPERWSNAPVAIVAIVGLLLLTGIAVIFQNEAAYRDLQQQEARVQAEILAASVTAALDFADRQAAQEAVDAIRVNRQVRTVGIYDAAGNLVAGYGRDGDDPPPQDRPRAALGTVVASSVPVLSGVMHPASIISVLVLPIVLSNIWQAIDGRRFGLTFRRFWQSEGGAEFTLAGESSWEPDERTRVNATANYTTSSEFIERNTFDPREINRTIASSGGISRRFTTRNTRKPYSAIDLSLVGGPFRHLSGGWRFRELGRDAGEAGCKVSLELGFAFDSRLVDMMFGPFFEETCNSLVDAFTRRAAAAISSPSFSTVRVCPTRGCSASRVR